MSMSRDHDQGAVGAEEALACRSDSGALGGMLLLSETAVALGGGTQVVAGELGPTGAIFDRDVTWTDPV